MVDDGRAALTKQAASLGIKFDENLQRAILQKDNEVAPENLPLLVQQVFEAGGKTFSALTGLPANARYTPKFVASEAGWNAYSSGVGDHFEIQINTRNSDNKYQSRTEGFIRHEVLGHALYHTTNLKRIQSKDLPQSAGLILLPAYDLLADEGCAEISKRIYATSPLASLSETMWDYDRLCLTNAYHTALNISPDAAEKQLRETSPYYKPENFRSHLKLLQDDQFWRYYLWGYGPARTFFRYAHEHLGENFGGFLKDCYTTPRDVVDLGKLAHAHGLTADQVNYGLRPAQPFMANSFPGSNTRPSARHIASTDGLGLT
jgi:hypothetical protein